MYPSRESETLNGNYQIELCPVSLYSRNMINNERIQNYSVGIVSEKDSSLLLSFLTARPLCKGRLERNALRLRAELDTGKVILLDADGCVAFEQSEHFVSPGTFLAISLLLQKMKVAWQANKG